MEERARRVSAVHLTYLANMNDLPSGVYKIYWANGGGTSVASLYRDKSGDPWIAPANWISPGKLLDLVDYSCISKMELIERAFGNTDG